MEAATLDEAIAVQNATDFGLTAGIHSLNPAEVEHWLDTVQAGNLYVNRGITGAIVRRQPFGGWKRSAVGAGAKAGGPNYLMTLGRWEPVETPDSDDLRLDGLDEKVASIIKKSQQAIDFAAFGWVRAAAFDDEAAWRGFYANGRDVSALGVERNILRYRPIDVTIRLSEGEALAPLVRLLAAAARVGSRVTVSSALPLPDALVAATASELAPLRVAALRLQTDDQWLAFAREGGIDTSRVRLIGGDLRALADEVAGSPDIAFYADPVTTSGRVELLPFLHEQAVSITAHRFGNPDAGMIGVRV
jgi:RHH-type transcriptional regulator, proline utilization regulon repressor / proline dehydrogenase / delta 1-pyrroline-5-carboxylate dehydrogenase